MLDRLARRRFDPQLVVGVEVARALCRLSHQIRRQLGILVDRGGRVVHVVVGDSRQIVIPALAKARTAGGRLRGLRCIHTHLAGEPLSEDDLMDLLFLRLDLMAVLTMDQEGLPTLLYGANLVPRPIKGRNWQFLPPTHPAAQPHTFLDTVSALEGEFVRLRPVREVDAGRDRALLISVSTVSRHLARQSMDELAELARSAGVEVLATIFQRRNKMHPKWLMGKGKLGEIMLQALRLNANLLIFDLELNPSQIRSITDHTELRVIDRTQLILDIFARRARSREGKLQIEMAQLKYMLPRLTLRDDALSRLTGGIGGRGPGETRLEVDRRRINDRLAKLTAQLRQVAKERRHRRVRRRKKSVPVLSLVGYTNAGKSTLLNGLTNSDIVAEDKLFATLDPTSRRLKFPRDVEVIITDTVGFIRHLPAELLQAFKATLEELNEADLLLHVIDCSNPRFREQIAVVEELLHEMGLDSIPTLRLLNKIDLIADDKAEELARELDGLCLSALDPQTYGHLLSRCQKAVAKIRHGLVPA